MTEQFVVTMRDFEDELHKNETVYDYFMGKYTDHYKHDNLIKQRYIFNIKVRLNTEDEIEKIKNKAMTMVNAIKESKIYPIIKISIHNFLKGTTVYTDEIIA